jgi:tetratricopeptide (TPR) repeat protein
MSLSNEKKLLRIQGEKLLKEGLIKEKNGEYADAIVNYKEAMSSFRIANDKSNTGLSYVYLGDVYLKTKAFVLARKAYDNGLTCFAETGDEERKALVLSLLGKTCFQSGDYQDALDFLEKSLKAYRMLKDEASERKIEKNIELVMAKIKEKPERE